MLNQILFMDSLGTSQNIFHDLDKYEYSIGINVGSSNNIPMFI